MSVDNKFARQIQLSEIGNAGQQAISQSALMVNASAVESTLEFAKIYGHSAGLLSEQLMETTSELPDGLLGAFRHPGSRSVGLGAAYALRSVLSALAVGSTLASPQVTQDASSSSRLPENS